MSSTSPVGTIAYIIDEEALLVRVNKGWQYIAVSRCFWVSDSSLSSSYGPSQVQPIIYDVIRSIFSTAGHAPAYRNAIAADNGSATAAQTWHPGIEFIDQRAGLWRWPNGKAPKQHGKTSN